MDEWTMTLLTEAAPALPPVEDTVPTGKECRECGEFRRSMMASDWPSRLLCRECRRAQQREAYHALARRRSVEDAESAFWEKYPEGKPCPRCKVPGDFEDYYPAPGQVCGVQTYCKTCTIRSGKRRPSDVDRPAVVYRLYGSTGLLYVGKAIDLRLRLLTGPSSHARTKPWWSEVTRVEVEEYASEADAYAAESEQIDRLHPPRNRWGGRRGLGTPAPPRRTFSIRPDDL